MLVFLLTSANLIYPRWLIDSNSQDYVGLFKNCEHSKEREREFIGTNIKHFHAKTANATNIFQVSFL